MSALLVRIFLINFPSIVDSSAAERTQNKSPVQYLLTEKHYPVPVYLADVFQMPEGWIDTSQVSADLIKSM